MDIEHKNSDNRKEKSLKSSKSNPKIDKVENMSIEKLINSLNDASELNSKSVIIDKLIKECGNSILKGSLLENLIKGLVASILE